MRLTCRSSCFHFTKLNNLLIVVIYCFLLNLFSKLGCAIIMPYVLKINKERWGRWTKNAHYVFPCGSSFTIQIWPWSLSDCISKVTYRFYNFFLSEILLHFQFVLHLSIDSWISSRIKSWRKITLTNYEWNIGIDVNFEFMNWLVDQNKNSHLLNNFLPDDLIFLGKGANKSIERHLDLCNLGNAEVINSMI